MPRPDISRPHHPSEIVVLARGVSMHYRDFSLCALDTVDLEILRGEIFGLVGPAGSGKSTLLKILAGRVRPTYGTVKIFGCSPPRAARKGRTGFVPDKTPGKAKSDANGISGLVGKIFQRTHPAGLAQVLAKKPGMLILDNPFSGLDSAACAATRELLQSLAREGATVLLGVASLLEVKELCHRLAIINAGKIEAIGPIEQLCATPKAVRYLAPVIPQASLQRALDQIRRDLGVSAPLVKPAEPQPDAAVPEQDQPAAPGNNLLSSLVKPPP